MLEQLKNEVCRANLLLKEYGLLVCKHGPFDCRISIIFVSMVLMHIMDKSKEEIL